MKIASLGNDVFGIGPGRLRTSRDGPKLSTPNNLFEVLRGISLIWQRDMKITRFRNLGLLLVPDHSSCVDFVFARCTPNTAKWIGSFASWSMAQANEQA